MSCSSRHGMIRKLKRTAPYITLLRSTPDNQKRKRIKMLPSFVIDDMVEILYNILYGNVTVKNPAHRKALMKHRNKLTKIVMSHKNKGMRRKLFQQQSGGMIASILPVLAGILAAAVL